MRLEISESEGEYLVKIARATVESYVKEGKVMKLPDDVPQKFREKAGVFVTLNKIVKGRKELRGCIGLPMPDKPLIEGLIEAAISSAVDDPRFPPVRPDELDDIVVEVSVLTPPELIQVKSPKEYLSKIKVGRDGLIVRWKYGSGLLLPQVPVEYGWDVEDFLCHTCIKAGAPPDCWLLPETKIYRFQGIVFEESSPRGKVVRKELE
ncbi:MAG: TIGR00296 family protein [Nitrososphaerota archaeon]|nr:TIGR00296 family protein [Nitrososphaerota archaeon]